VKLIPLRGTSSTDPAGREILSLTHLEAHVGSQHPSLLSILHVGKTAEHLFYVMEPADDLSGSAASLGAGYRPASLASRLCAGPLPPEDCLNHARQLLGGLAHLHAAGMVHRDVKPANCLFVGGALKLADFGLLTGADPQVSRIGTLQYMPPDGRMDARADVYAAGLVIYEMLTGLPADCFPRLGERAAEVAQDTILQALNRLVLRACQANPRQRFANAGEMLAQLTAPQGQPATRQRWRRPVLVALACLLAAIALAAVALVKTTFWPGRVERVEVNFITEPFEATIYLDGSPLLQPDDSPYTTPCTVPDLPAQVHHVVFQHEGLGDLDAGPIDFAKTREVTARWHPPP